MMSSSAWSREARNWVWPSCKAWNFKRIIAKNYIYDWSSNMQLILLNIAPSLNISHEFCLSRLRSDHPCLVFLVARFATGKMKNKVIPACSVRLLTRISSTELQRTGSVRSSSAFSNQLLKAEAFLANNRNKSSTLDKRKMVAFISDALLSNIVRRLRLNKQNGEEKKTKKKKTHTQVVTFLYWSWACWSRSFRVLESSSSCSHLRV